MQLQWIDKYYLSGRNATSTGWYGFSSKSWKQPMWQTIDKYKITNKVL